MFGVSWFWLLKRDMASCSNTINAIDYTHSFHTLTHIAHQSKEHLLKLLDGPTKDKDSDNATTLLKALQKTILFEKEMMAWLQRDFGTIFLVNDGKAPTATNQTAIRGDQGEVLEFDESGRAVAASSAQGIRIKYERQKREQRKGESEKIAAAALDEGRASVEQAPVDPLVGVASSAFDNFMAPYIALEEQSMDEQLVESLGDGAVDTRGELPVFTSSTALFVYIKGSITRCTAMTKGKAFFLLFQAFQDSLNKYAQILGGKLPQPASTSQNTVVGGINIGSSFGKQQGPPSNKGASIAIPKGGEVTVCHVISTCEYCADTVEALEDLIRDTIEQKFKDRIDMSSQQEHFHDVTAKCITVLVSGLMNRLQEALKTMTDINWATFDMVGEESSYVRMIQKEWVPFFATVRGLVPSSYFRSFCDKFAMAFSSSYFSTLIRLKRIGEMATQQLLLDAYNLKTAMLKLPVVEATHTQQRATTSGAATSIAPAMYTKMVTKQFKRIETLLKLVGTPNAMLIDVFRVQWPGGSALDLQTVMNLKGLKRNEQATMLEGIGLDPQTALRGATAGVTSEDLVAERMQEIRQRSSDAAVKVTNDLSQMRQKVDDFRKAFR
jgi:vacuolar protein sorting-associated protein 53